MSGGLITNVSNNKIIIATPEQLNDHRNGSPISNNQVYITEAPTQNSIDTAAELAVAMTTGVGTIAAIDVSANPNAILVIGGADEATIHFIYGIENDSTTALSHSEIHLLGTVTTDFTDGIQGLVVDNFIF